MPAPQRMLFELENVFGSGDDYTNKDLILTFPPY